MMLNNLHKWVIQRNGLLCADTLLLLGAGVYLGVTLWAVDAWIARDRVCTRLESDAKEDKENLRQQRLLEAMAAGEREAWRKKVLAERPQTARIMAVEWNDAGKRRATRPGTQPSPALPYQGGGAK